MIFDTFQREEEYSVCHNDSRGTWFGIAAASRYHLRCAVRQQTGEDRRTLIDGVNERGMKRRGGNQVSKTVAKADHAAMRVRKLPPRQACDKADRLFRLIQRRAQVTTGFDLNSGKRGDSRHGV